MQPPRRKTVRELVDLAKEMVLTERVRTTAHAPMARRHATTRMYELHEIAKGLYLDQMHELVQLVRLENLRAEGQLRAKGDRLGMRRTVIPGMIPPGGKAASGETPTPFPK